MSSIGSVGGTSTPASSSAGGFAALSSDEFLEIIFAELSAQDPLEPQDTQALLDQINSLREIEADLALQDQLGELVDQNGFATAANLIGNLVSGITTDGRRAADLVLSVSQTAEGPVLNLFDGSRMLFSMVDEVIGPLDLDVPDDGSGNGSGDGDGGDGNGDGSGGGSGGGTDERVGGADGIVGGGNQPPVSDSDSGAVPGVGTSPPVIPLRPSDAGIGGSSSRPNTGSTQPSLLDQLRGILP